jgi:polar amino acid transport system substrate-binding protein
MPKLGSTNWHLRSKHYSIGERMKYSTFIILTSLLLPNLASSQSKEITASFGGSLAPFVFEEGPSGLLVDILKECLEPSGYKLNSELHPYARRITEYQNGQVDIVTDINQKIIDERGLKGFYTGNVYAYENFLYSLSERKFKVQNINELSDYSLLSWQGAITHIGGEYAAMASKHNNYSETHNQKTQLRMLFSKRVDFIQMDGSIYEYFRQEMLKDGGLDVTVPVDVTPLFGKSPNGFLFKSEEARDACLSNMERVKQNSKYKNTLYFGE